MSVSGRASLVGIALMYVKYSIAYLVPFTAQKIRETSCIQAVPLATSNSVPWEHNIIFFVLPNPSLQTPHNSRQKRVCSISFSDVGRHFIHEFQFLAKDRRGEAISSNMDI